MFCLKQKNATTQNKSTCTSKCWEINKPRPFQKLICVMVKLTPSVIDKLQVHYVNYLINYLCSVTDVLNGMPLFEIKSHQFSEALYNVNLIVC